MAKNAIFPGSFDPMHEGHVSIVSKAAKIFDFIYVVVTINPDKNHKDDFIKREAIAKKYLKNFDNVKVITNKDKLTADLAKELNIKYLIRSARNGIDFNYELELAAGNKSLNSELETIIFFPDLEYIDYNSTLIRHRESIKKLNKK